MADDNPLGALWGAIKKADPTGALQKGEDVVTGGQAEADRRAQQLKDEAARRYDQAKETGASVLRAITGEEAPRELTANEVKEVQSALGLSQGAVGPKTRAGVTEFAKANGIDPNTVISADQKHLIGTPEFLGAIESVKGVDLSFYTPTPAVQDRVTDTLGEYAAKARDGIAGAASAAGKAPEALAKGGDVACIKDGGHLEPGLFGLNTCVGRAEKQGNSK
ncbi:MAG: hypothetical protein U1E36_05600 [Rickettsiales bacterium]